MHTVQLAGIGLHGGRRCSVRLTRKPGPVTLQIGDHSAALSDSRVTGTARGVRVALGDGGPEVELVEHLFAALAGLSIHESLVISVEGGELPLLDGACDQFARALTELDLPRSPPRSRIVRPWEVTVGSAIYRFAPQDDVRLQVDVDFPGVGRERADYHGTEGEFRSGIAQARTFGYLSEAASLRDLGLARGANAASVLVLDDAGVAVPPCAPRREGELGRHKLLDLMGDLYFYGGPPRGLLSTERPGHTATHQILPQALALGVIEVDGLV